MSAVFVYGSMASAGSISAILGRAAREGHDYVKAALPGWRRRWNVGTDNTTSRTVRYYTPGTGERPDIHVLFLNVVPAGDPAAAVTGYLMVTGTRELAALDAREGNYDRVPVTLSTPGRAEPVWTYVGKPDRVAGAEEAIRHGSARIRQEYLEAVRAAFAGHDDMTAELRRSLTPMPAPVEPLTRVVSAPDGVS